MNRVCVASGREHRILSSYGRRVSRLMEHGYLCDRRRKVCHMRREHYAYLGTPEDVTTRQFREVSQTVLTSVSDHTFEFKDTFVFPTKPTMKYRVGS